MPKGKKPRPLTYRINERGCHICISHKVHQLGYVQLTRGYKVQAAQRVVFEDTYGPVPDGMFVCHTCDNRSCINPEHLFLGTHQDNMDDMVRKNRGYKGVGVHNPRAKITPKQVREIRASGESTKVLAERYGLSPHYVPKIKRGVRWTHIA